MMNLLPDAALGPSAEAFVYGIGLAEAFRQIFPWCSSACNPEYGINEQTVILGISAWFSRLPWQQGRNAFKIFIGDRVAVHRLERRCKLPLNDLRSSKVPAVMKFSFVHTT